MALHIQSFTVHDLRNSKLPGSEIVALYSNGLSVVVAVCKGPQHGDNAAFIRDAFSEREYKAVVNA